MIIRILSLLRRLIRLPVAASLAVPLMACHGPIQVHGNEPDPQAVTQIIPGHSTKADVTGLLGSPTSTATFDPDTWYYVSRRMVGSSFSNPTLVSQKVYIVEFDNQGVVKDFQTRLNDAPSIDMITRTTPAPGRELGLMQQLLGNFGRFNESGGGDLGGAGGKPKKE